MGTTLLQQNASSCSGAQNVSSPPSFMNKNNNMKPPVSFRSAGESSEGDPRMNSSYNFVAGGTSSGFSHIQNYDYNTTGGYHSNYKNNHSGRKWTDAEWEE